MGDAVLEVHTTEAIFVTFPKLRPAGMVHLRNRLVCTNMLAYFSDLYGLPSKLRVGNQQLDHGRSPKNRADVMEAYIGAVYRDRESGVSRKWLIDLLEPFVHSYLKDVENEFNERMTTDINGNWVLAVNKFFGKNRLEWLFRDSDKNGLDGVASWLAILKIDNVRVAEVAGSSKKNAKYIISAMIADEFKIPDGLGKLPPNNFKNSVKRGKLYVEDLKKFYNKIVESNKQQQHVNKKQKLNNQNSNNISNNNNDNDHN